MPVLGLTTTIGLPQDAERELVDNNNDYDVHFISIMKKALIKSYTVTSYISISLHICVPLIITLYPSDLDTKYHGAVSQWCKTQNIDLVMVGPEDPLADGLVDHMTEEG